jgi:undecaprenyl diphosphate synthase
MSARQDNSASVTALASEPSETRARYVAIICDGNARWARAHALSVVEGHRAATNRVLACIRDATRLGVRELTIYSFSTENWSRPREEIEGLMELIGRRVELETPRLDAEDVRMRFIGRRQSIPPTLAHALDRAESLTTDNGGLKLFVALNYGGRAEILDAARRFGGTTEQEFREFMYAPEMHDPDVIIRTGGERRLSNYLLWQAAYAELVFRDELWPDFNRAAFEAALAEFADRQRRFGGRSAITADGQGVERGALASR